MDYKEQYEREFEDELRNLKKNKPNLMLVGVSGSGKSSLINCIFGEDVAPVGAGKPITTKIQKYSSDKSLINIFDTMGYEVKNENENTNQFEREVYAEIEQRKLRPLVEHIHIIWYCIPITNHRIYDYDIYNLQRLSSSNIPLFITFTKCDEDSETNDGKGMIAEEYKRRLQEKGFGKAQIFETATSGEMTFDLNRLIEVSADSLEDKNLRKSFVHAQLHNLSLKKDEASTIIHTASVASGAAAAIPIPVADAPIIVSIQVGMALKLANIYGFGMIGESATALLQSQIISMAGKQLASSLTKFIPFIGSAINAAVAVSFTEALGWGLVTIYENVLEEYLRTGKEPQWAAIFSSDILINLLKNKFK